MPTAVETLSPTRVRLTVDVPFADLKPEIDGAYKAIGAQVRVQGFRPGKVPPRILDQRVGRGTVLEEAVQKAVPRLYGEAVQESGIKPLAQPQVEVTKIEDNEQLTFTAEVDVRPDFELPAVDGLAVVVEAVTVGEPEIQEQVDALRERFATAQPVERAAIDGDTLTLDLAATVDGKAIEGGTAEGLSYKLGDGTMLAGLDEALQGVTSGAARSFQTALVAGEHEGRTADVAVTVRQVAELVLPQVDDEWVATITGMEGGVEAFRADVRSRLDRSKKLQQGVDARDKVLEAVLAKVELPLPEAILEAEIAWRRQSVEQQLSEGGLTMEGFLASEDKTVESWEGELRDSAREAVKAQLVLDAIADAEQIGVNDSDLSEQVVRRAERAGVSPDQYAQQLVDGGQIPVLAAEIRRGKALAQVMEAATITDSQGTAVDLEALRADQPGSGDGDVQVDDDGRRFHLHPDGSVHYLDEQ